MRCWTRGPFLERALAILSVMKATHVAEVNIKAGSGKIKTLGCCLQRHLPYVGHVGTSSKSHENQHETRQRTAHPRKAILSAPFVSFLPHAFNVTRGASLPAGSHFYKTHSIRCKALPACRPVCSQQYSVDHTVIRSKWKQTVLSGIQPVVRVCRSVGKAPVTQES